MMTMTASNADDGPVDINIFHVILAALPILGVALITAHLRLQLHNKILIGVVRATGQLSFLGWILVPIFTSNIWWMTLAYCILMVLVAAAEAVSRPQYTYPGVFFTTCISMSIVTGVIIVFAMIYVIGIDPWYDPQYLIPMLGMLLGNTCSSVSVGLSTVLNEFVTKRDTIEMLLAFGATRIEATRDLMHHSIHLAMTPLFNMMNVVGIVSIPGMMTGQILGGSDPSMAARYQIVIIFLIGASSSINAMVTIFLAVISLCSSNHQLVPDGTLIHAQKKGSFVSRVTCWVKEKLSSRGQLHSNGRASATNTRLSESRVSTTEQLQTDEETAAEEASSLRAPLLEIR